MKNLLEAERLMRADQSWPVLKLKYLSQLKGGGTPTKDVEAFWSDGTIPWVSPKDMKQRIIADTEDHITEEAVYASSTSYVDEGSPLLVARSGILRHSLPIALAGRKMTLNQDMKAFALSKRLDSRFFVYWIEGQSAELLLEWRQFGATVESIDVPRMMNSRIALPDLATQTAIAAFLDRETARIDQLIEKKQQLVVLLEVRQQALLESLVKGQATPSSEMRASGIEWIGQVPAHWQVPRVNQVARLESGHTPSRNEERYWVAEECTIPWFTLGDIWQVRQEGKVYVSSTQEKISPIGMANSAARLLPADTVILSRTASVGFPAILRVPMATTQDFVNWISGPQLRPKYLYYVFRAMRREFDRLMIGSTHKTIYMPDVRSFSTPLPPLAEQDEIVLRLDRILEEHKQLVAKTESTVAILGEYRASVITAAVTGQLDISAWTTRGETERRLVAVEAAV